MEFIASLSEARSKSGITPETLQHLENVFRQTVGTNQEITLEQFNQIVQSKNMFFVERMFKLFDTDQSGSISLEEFMNAMRNLAARSAEEKLRYLFSIYDLDGDGLIQPCELRHVVKSCMDENNLKFSNEEIDDLSMALFEDADTDRTGSITYEELKAQLERHPGLIENLSMSVERWLLPPAPTKQKTYWNKIAPRKLRWSYIRNNYVSVIFLVVFLFTNATLFVTRAKEYQDFGAFVAIARACGQCLNFTCTFILVLMLRRSITWLRSLGYSEYLPLDHHVYYHKMTGWFIFVYSVVHTVMHVCNFVMVSRVTGIPVSDYLLSTHLGIGWVAGTACLTGWFLLGILFIMIISSQSYMRRKGKFEIFYYSHLLYVLFWIILILHGPSFWQWFLTPGLVFLMESTLRIRRNISGIGQTCILKGVLLPSRVTHLVVKRPPHFDFHPGDYVYAKIPAIAQYEWHPFTISSAPEQEDMIWLHIRAVGEWTNRLFSYFDEHQRVAHNSYDGPACVIDMDKSQKEKEDLNANLNLKLAAKLKGEVALVMEKPVGFYRPIQPAIEMYEVSSSHKEESSSVKADSPSTVNGKDKNTSTSPEESTMAKECSSSCSSIDSGTEYTADKKSDKVSLCTPKSPPDDHQSISSLDVGSTCSPETCQKDPKNGDNRPLRRNPSVGPRGLSYMNKGLRRRSTVILCPEVGENEKVEKIEQSRESEDSSKEPDVEDVGSVIVTQTPLTIYLDGPYGSPSSHIFRTQHAVMIATGIGVTPFASILQSIMYRYQKSRHTCPSCQYCWMDRVPALAMKLRKVDFFWINRDQRSFEWFVSLLSQLELQQAEIGTRDRFLDIHMYITSALDKTDMKALGLQMALDLLHAKEKRDLITGLKTRTQPGRPNWDKVFRELAAQKKGRVTVFFCGPPKLGRILHTHCNKFGFQFRKEIF